MRLPKVKKINTEKYMPGLGLFKRKPIGIKLSANECSLGPSPKAIREFNKEARSLKRYPINEGRLEKIIAKKFRLDPKKIILGSGSDQILEFICRVFLNKNDEVVLPKYSFIIYRIYSKINGAKIRYAKEDNFTISVDNILSCVTRKTKIVFLANPNNPTGTYINKKKLTLLRKKLRSDILLVVDDAYFEYVKKKDYSSGLNLFSKSKNVITTRTFSKVYGLAGLRIGWGYGSKEIIQGLLQVKPPFNINRPALEAAAASLKDHKWLAKEIKHIKHWSKILFKVFKKLKIETNEANGNFFLLKFDKVRISAANVFKFLAKKGILLRKMDVYGIKNSLRVTIGTSKENKKLISELKKLI